MSTTFEIIALGAFIFWCYIGLVWFQLPKEWKFVKAVTFGFVQSVLLFVFRFLMYYASFAFAGLFSSGTAERIVLYLFLYLPLVWLQWCIVAALMRSHWSGIRDFLFGSPNPSLKWKLIGSLITIAIEFPQSFLWQMILQAMSSPDGNAS